MNDLYLTAKNKKSLQIKSLSQKVYIIRHEVTVYHPSENEYISLSGEYLIITEFLYTLKRDDMQKKSDFLALFDDMHHTSCGDDIPLLRNG